MAIVTSPGNKAETVRTRLQQGQDFSRLALENSIDLESARKGGEMGWIPKGVDDMITPGQIRAMGILTKTKPEAEKVREAVLAGKDFAELARTRLWTKKPGKEEDKPAGSPRASRKGNPMHRRPMN